MDARDLNSGLHVWLASALPTEASLQPHAFLGGTIGLSLALYHFGLMVLLS